MLSPVMQQVHSNKKAILGWTLYDFANSAFTTLVVTFVYGTYFASGIVSDKLRGMELWSLGITVSAIIIAILSPVLGALADAGGHRKRYLIVSTWLTIFATVLLFFPTAGEIRFALGVFVFANVCYELGYVFYNAYLVEVAPPSKIGMISGYGWGFGYFGGLACMVLALVCLIQPEVPWFGFSQENGENIRAVNLLVAAWFALFSLPMFLWIPPSKANGHAVTSHPVRSAFKRLNATFHEIRTEYQTIFKFLIARLVYNDGLITVFAFGGIYAEQIFDFSMQEIMYFGIVLNVAAGVGALIFGFVDDRLGPRQTILISLIGLTIATTLAVTAPSRTLFWVAGILMGLLAGPNQSASRSLMGRLVPKDKENEFFGFFAFSGKATSFLGPLLLGQLTALFGSQRAGLSSTVFFFIVGGILLFRLKEIPSKH
jgi:UMF1 family MFS transporter